MISETRTHVYVPASSAETSTFLGMQNRIMLTADHTGGAAGVVDISVLPGAGAPLHTNTREALIWYVVDGALTLQTEEGPVEMEQGAASFLPKGSTHTFVNTTDRVARALLICVPGGLEDFLLSLSGKLPAELPAGPPPAEAIDILVGTAERYGVKVHTQQ